MGYTREEVKEALANQKYNEVTATYLLLGRKNEVWMLPKPPFPPRLPLRAGGGLPGAKPQWGGTRASNMLSRPGLAFSYRGRIRPRGHGIHPGCGRRVPGF